VEPVNKRTGRLTGIHYSSTTKQPRQTSMHKRRSTTETPMFCWRRRGRVRSARTTPAPAKDSFSRLPAQTARARTAARATLSAATATVLRAGEALGVCTIECSRENTMAMASAIRMARTGYGMPATRCGLTAAELGACGLQPPTAGRYRLRIIFLARAHATKQWASFFLSI